MTDHDDALDQADAALTDAHEAVMHERTAEGLSSAMAALVHPDAEPLDAARLAWLDDEISALGAMIGRTS